MWVSGPLQRFSRKRSLTVAARIGFGIASGGFEEAMAVRLEREQAAALSWLSPVNDVIGRCWRTLLRPCGAGLPPSL